jgi:4-amino-4-deoxy-L-arabinose transferase-like glycosyltransferase
VSSPDAEVRFDERRWVLLLTVAALVLRASWLLELADLPWADELPSDSAVYDAVARRFAQGDWMLGPGPLRMSPGYFYVLGVVHAIFGSGVWAIRVVQAVGGALCVPLTWRLARATQDPVPSVICAGLVAFSGPLVFFDGAILPESLSALSVTLAALAIVHAVADARGRVRGWPAWSAVGACVGVLSVLRPNALVLLAPAAWLAVRGPTQGRAPRLAALVLALAACVAPITLRNWLATERWVLLTAHGGVNLYVGNGPGASGTFRVPPEVPEGGSPSTQFEAFREAASREVGRELDESEADRHWMSRTLAHASAHHVEATVLLARKTHLLFNARELGLVLPYAFSRESTRTMGAPLVQTGWLAPWALLGLLWAAFRRHGAPDRDAGRDARERALALTSLTLAASIVLVFVTDRYRAPLVPLFVVHAVAAVTTLVRFVRARAWRHFTCLGLATLLALVVAIPVRANQHFEREWVAFGDAFAVREEHARALEAYERALAISPTHPWALRGAAIMRERLGDEAGSNALWRALAASPEAPAPMREQARAVLTRRGGAP